MEDADIRSLVIRLSRPHPSGGEVIERAAIVAEGAHASDVFSWIAAHHGEPELAVAKAAGSGGLHGGSSHGGAETSRPPLRYVLPPGSLA